MRIFITLVASFLIGFGVTMGVRESNNASEVKDAQIQLEAVQSTYKSTRDKIPTTQKEIEQNQKSIEEKQNKVNELQNVSNSYN